MRNASFIRTGLLALTAFALTVSVAGAAVLTDERFEYANGTSLEGQNPAVGGVWTVHSGSGTPILISNGAAIVEQGASDDLNSGFGSQGVNAVLYYCADVRVDGPIPAGDEYFIHFSDGGTSVFRARLTCTQPGAGGDYRLAIAATSFGTTAPVPWTSDLTLGVTYRVVVKWDNPNGTATMWINPTSEASPSVNSPGGETDGDMSSIVLRQDSSAGGAYIVDNLSVGEAFDEVCLVDPLPNASQMGLVAMALLLLGGGAAYAYRRREQAV